MTSLVRVTCATIRARIYVRNYAQHTFVSCSRDVRHTRLTRRDERPTRRDTRRDTRDGRHRRVTRHACVATRRGSGDPTGHSPLRSRWNAASLSVII